MLQTKLIKSKSQEGNRMFHYTSKLYTLHIAPCILHLASRFLSHKAKGQPTHSTTRHGVCWVVVCYSIFNPKTFAWMDWNV